MIVIETHTVEDNSEHRRMVDYCIGLFPQLQSRNAVKKALKREELLLNDQVSDTGKWVSVGDSIALVEGKRRIPQHYELSVEIVFQDEHFVVVNKPAGLVVSGNQFKTLENALVGQVELSSEEDALKWPVPVHRLDSSTSGLVICAKTYSARIALMKQFEQGNIRKTYRAIVTGKFEGEITVELPVADKEASSLLIHESCVPSLRNEFLTLVRLHPITGRTHQLRIHCASIGHPIVGDVLYGEEGNVMRHKGLFLTATELSLKHPITGKEIELQIELPSKFNALMKREEVRFKKFRSI